MRISAKADYAVRAATELAARRGRAAQGRATSRAQEIPLRFLENILGELRQPGIVRSQRGAEGGYWLAQPADEISVADVIRAVEGPLVGVRGERPEEIEYAGSAEPLQRVWIALRANLRGVLENVTLADVAERQAAGASSTGSPTTPRPGSRAERRRRRRGADGGARRRSRPRQLELLGLAAGELRPRGRSPSPSVELDAHLEARGARRARSAPPRRPSSRSSSEI